MSTRKTERPSVRLATSGLGVVRASSSMRSEWAARDVHIFCPFTMYLSPRFCAKVRSDVVSVPLAGSVTPKACRRSSPLAIRGRYCCFCASLPWRSKVPMMYIWAWQALALPPERWISSRMAAAADRVSPEPP